MERQTGRRRGGCKEQGTCGRRIDHHPPHTTTTTTTTKALLPCKCSDECGVIIESRDNGEGFGGVENSNVSMVSDCQ
jgi:hypothetical protein